MHIEYLKIFADLGRCGNFSHAAELNDISQAAVSRVIGLLEKRLAVRLVDRSTRPLRLTGPGMAFLEGCMSLVERYKELEAAVGASQFLMSSNIRIAAIYSVGLRDMSRYVETFEKQNPGVGVHIEYVHPATVYEKVLDGKADFGLVSYARRARNLTVLPWREEEMLLTCSPDHPFAHHRSIRLAQLNGQRYIGFTRELPIRQNVDRFLRQHKVTVDVILEFDNIECVKKALELGSGLALLPEPMLRHEVQSGTLVAIPLSGRRFVRTLSIIYRRNPELSPPASGFIALICQPENIHPGIDAARGRGFKTPRTVRGIAPYPSHQEAPRTRGIHRGPQ
jgi:DNA-binding transcriptional LysR family regulator